MNARVSTVRSAARRCYAPGEQWGRSAGITWEGSLTTRIFCEARSERTPAGASAENGAAPIMKLPEVRAVVAMASARRRREERIGVASRQRSRLPAEGRNHRRRPQLARPARDARLKPLRRFMPGEEIDPASGPFGLRVAASSQLADGEPVAFSFVESDETAPPAPTLNGARPLRSTMAPRSSPDGSALWPARPDAYRSRLRPLAAALPRRGGELPAS